MRHRHRVVSRGQRAVSMAVPMTCWHDGWRGKRRVEAVWMARVDAFLAPKTKTKQLGVCAWGSAPAALQSQQLSTETAAARCRARQVYSRHRRPTGRMDVAPGSAAGAARPS